MIRIFLNKNDFSLVENGVDTFRYNEFDNVINELLKENKKFKVFNEKILPIREAKIIKLNDNTYRILYAFNWNKSLCFQAKHSYFTDLETKDYALSKYQTFGMYSYSSHETQDVLGEKIISFTM